MFGLGCNHKWKIEEYSNVVQLDEMGYPLMLVICNCSKCNKTSQQWRDVSKDILEQKDICILKWKKKYK